MKTGGFYAGMELGGHFFVGMPASKKLEHLTFSRCESFARGETSGQFACHDLSEIGAAAMNHPNRIDQLVSSGVLQQIPAGSRTHRLENELVLGKCGDRHGS